MLQQRSYAEKITFFFRWALQNISSFGQNVRTVHQPEGNIMVLCIIYTAVVLFFFLVGKLQQSLQAEDEGWARIQKLGEIKRWKPFENLPEDLKSHFKNQIYRYDVLGEIKAVNIEIIFNGLPEKLRRKMSYELCKDLLEKVEQFKGLSEEKMNALREHVRPVFFPRRSRIIREGDAIDEMIFVVQGRLWSYTSRSDGGNQRNEYWTNGDTCGEELVDWLQADPCNSDLPISVKTIQAS
ncbi:cyclic nucleotide-gated ion channel 1-like isoform X2 [Pistacia vera]|uniref:cyclic nucleotide-gated ion channel 1-like isoform X2 n=1 Tax=Pistacia vera TaxID=55513 RepID=UPI00126352F0|nr:cyclic nucleotide-gated ion channel 1-like isoform X2 [Pistacia vera]